MDFYPKIFDEKLHTIVYQLAFVDTLAEFGIHVLPKSAPINTEDSFDFKYGKREHGWPTKEDTDFLMDNFNLFCDNLKKIYHLYSEDKKFLKLLEQVAVK